MGNMQYHQSLHNPNENNAERIDTQGDHGMINKRPTIEGGTNNWSSQPAEKRRRTLSPPRRRLTKWVDTASDEETPPAAELQQPQLVNGIKSEVNLVPVATAEHPVNTNPKPCSGVETVTRENDGLPVSQLPGAVPVIRKFLRKAGLPEYHLEDSCWIELRGYLCGRLMLKPSRQESILATDLRKKSHDIEIVRTFLREVGIPENHLQDYSWLELRGYLRGRLLLKSTRLQSAAALVAQSNSDVKSVRKFLKAVGIPDSHLDGCTWSEICGYIRGRSLPRPDE